MTKTMKSMLSLLLSLLLLLPALGLAQAPVDETVAPDPQSQQEIKNTNFFASLKLTYLDGSPFDASVFQGKPVFLNIFATWCNPCLAEMPDLDELAKEYKDKITIVGLHAEGLTVKQEGESASLVPDAEKNQAALKLKEEKGYTYPLLNPDTSLFLLMNDPQYGMNVQNIPTTWLIDGEGFIRDVEVGSRDKEAWKTVIDSFLKVLEEETDAKGEG